MEAFPAVATTLFNELNDILPTLESDVKVKAIESLKSSFLKKYIDSTSETYTANEQVRSFKAIDKFIAANLKCSEWHIGLVKQDPEVELVWGESKRILNEVLYEDGFLSLTWNSIVSNMNTGPGKSVGVSEVSFYHKVGFDKMTCSSEFLRDYYLTAIRSNSLWNSSEICRAKHFGEISIVKSSSLTTVPKTTEINRTICTEPSLNMMFQKGIAQHINRVLEKHFAIKYEATRVALGDLAFRADFVSGDLLQLGEISILGGTPLQWIASNFPDKLQPELNQDMAGIGSETGEYDTIDLSSASDTISYKLVRELFPKAFCEILEKARCKTTKLPKEYCNATNSVQEVDLHMFSSMGNGYTFPLETLIFATLVRSVYRVLGLPFKKSQNFQIGNFGVFGDDIICCHEASSLLVKSLEAFGFTVNPDKSFFTGNFRESCGADFYKGVNIRGVYLKKYHSLQDKFVTINLLHDWSVRIGIPIPKTIAFLYQDIGNGLIPVSKSDPIDSGVRVTLEEAMDPRIFGRFAVKKLWYKSKQINAYQYRRYEAEVRKYRPSSGRATIGKKMVKLPPNEPAMLLASFKGELRDGLIATISHSHVRYKLVDVVVPNWNHHDLLTAYLLDKYGLL